MGSKLNSNLIRLNLRHPRYTAFLIRLAESDISVTCHAALLANAFGVARAEEDPRLKKFTENRALSGGDISGALTIGKARVKLWM